MASGHRSSEWSPVETAEDWNQSPMSTVWKGHQFSNTNIMFNQSSKQLILKDFLKTSKENFKKTSD